MKTLPRGYDFWAELVTQRQPVTGAVVLLTVDEWEELATLRGTRRRPRLLFGRRVEISTETGVSK